MEQPKYTVKLDIYSFGVLILHVLSGEWPFPTNRFQKVKGSVIAVTEVDRRAEYLEKIGRDHPLSDLIRQCLSNMARQRPEAGHILQLLDSERRGERPSVCSAVQDGATARGPQSQVSAWNLL